MTKWTIESINANEEVKFGIKVEITGGNVFQHTRLLVGKSENRLATVIKDGDMVALWSVDEIERRDFKFYRPDGTEILPPEEVKTKKGIETEFTEKAKVLIKFLNDYPTRFNPHHEIRITSAYAHILSGELGIRCEDYLKD